MRMMKYLRRVWNWVCRTVSVEKVKIKRDGKQAERQKRKTGKPVCMLAAMERYLLERYDFRYNRLTEETEFRQRNILHSYFMPVGERQLNSFCIDARLEGVDCWDRDILRYINSDKIADYHPFGLYMEELPAWDGKDRIAQLAGRVSEERIWTDGFHRWMLGLAAQWMEMTNTHANSVSPLLVSVEQGKLKSTFCKVLVPEVLQRYYTDSFDLSSPRRAESKLAAFGLINLDEFDKLPEAKMALLKNLMQMAELNVRKAYRKNYSSLPRIASFIGTSNRKDLLTDPTGNRRFLCVEVVKKIDCDNLDHPQMYAQLKTELLPGERYWFSPEEEAEIQRHNAAFYKQSPEEEVFGSCYRAAGKGEACKLFSSADIFQRLKKTNPAAMCGALPGRFSQVLIKAGVERVHTKDGNRFRVVEVNPVNS